MIALLKKFILYLLSEPETNSRFIFLLQGMAGALGILVIGIMFVFTTTDRTLYPEMILALSASTGSAAAGRWLTKKVGPAGRDQTQP